MKPFLLPWLVCPVDGGPLKADVFTENDVTLNDQHREEIDRRRFLLTDFNKEWMDGLLYNPRLKLMYPLYRGVPRLLIFRHPLLDAFRETFDDRVRSYESEGYTFPDDDSIPGERSVLASFSNEWTGYGFDEDAYWGQEAEVYNESLYETIYNEHQDLRGKFVLEVGIGSGGSANYMCNKFGANLIGVDLGYATDVAFQHFGKNPFLHIAQTSVFNPGIRESAFDFVYSHGVIHHTYNTRRAFDKLSRMPKKGGRLYVWVYSYRNERRSLKRRVLMLLETLIRPWCSRLPGTLQTVVIQPLVPLYVFHQNTVYSGKKGMARYGYREALYAARDRFTPRYIHRHSEAEVMGWFQDNGFEQIRPLSSRTFSDFVTPGFYMNTGVEGFRKE